MPGDPRHDLLFCGYQAAGNPGRDIQSQGGKPGAWVLLGGNRYDLRAGIHTLGGFSAHANQKDRLNFVGRIPKPARQVRIVHGDDGAKVTLGNRIRQGKMAAEALIP